MKIMSVVVSLPLFLIGCAHNQTTFIVQDKIDAPKVIALDAPRVPWIVDIEARLRQNGFKVLRWSSQKYVRERVNENRVEEFQESSARYVLAIDGHALTDVMNRCFGGGYSFDYLTAELIDTQTNETIFNVQGSGYSENCPPMSGTLYANIVNAVNDAWK